MKYIIDLPENQTVLFFDGEYMNTIVPDKNEQHVFGDSCIGATTVKLVPYIEPKYTAEDAWELARTVSAMPIEAMGECFNEREADYYVFSNPFPEAMKMYESWKEKNKIKIGDEVTSSLNKIGVVTEVGDNMISYMLKNGHSYSTYRNNVKRTGRHFPEVAELLEKI